MVACVQTRGADGEPAGQRSSREQCAARRRSEIEIGDETRTRMATGRPGGSFERHATCALRRQDFNRVDRHRRWSARAGYPVDAVADYVAMVTLAQIDPQAQTRDYPTILNLFAEDPDNASFEMTNWDIAYLHGLYRTTRNAASATQQVRDISRRMAGDRGG